MYSGGVFSLVTNDEIRPVSLRYTYRKLKRVTKNGGGHGRLRIHAVHATCYSHLSIYRSQMYPG